MHGRLEGEQRLRRRHMWPVPALTTSSVIATDSASISPNSFSKDGRKIHVGDCALFKPPHDSPPFIGIIRRLILSKEDSLSLSVNWLYRPADIKLGKGFLLEAAPNEVFYSFHKDEIPAASLLHPCKVGFLCKGVELPSGVSSFICRRVYDIENKCLWWLTDKDYINERQEEVDQLLDKTRVEMYGALQSGGRSPKPLNSPTGTPQLKPGADTVQNSSSSFPSQVKGKKRERGDQGSDPVKRERLSKGDDADSGQIRPELILKSEIAKITDKGGLIDFDGVEKLVQLMQPEGAEKKMDLACRIMLVDVIAVTDKFDCLGRFVQLRGLPVLDEWLQEVHKGKINDGNSCKESDKTVEEFLLALLRALDKLPVNLHALQTCNVGKSVNHLRTHKNSEIQKKARSLVDTWKKRVEAEMNIIDAKSGSIRGGSWPTKSIISEASHVGGRRGGGSSEVGVKSSVVQSSASKTPSVKHGSGESVTRYSLVSPGSTKLSASATMSGFANSRDLNSATLVGGGTSDMPLTTIKEEKSSSSSQSQNNSQSCSSDQAKTGASSCREDARSSTAGSMSVHKSSSAVSRSRKSSNALHGSAVSGAQKETSSARFGASNQNLDPEKASPTQVTCERVPDQPLVDNGNSQRLIVRLPNTGRSPACSASGGSPEDPSVTSCKASSPVHCERLDHHERRVKGKCDPLRANSASNMTMESFQGKDGLSESNDIQKSSSCAPCDEQSRDYEDGEKNIDATKGLGSSSSFMLKPGKIYEASFSSMNALIESCAKFSEANASASVGDDIGMTLLASVAAGEISRSNVSPLSSPARTSQVPEDSCSGNDFKLRQFDEDGAHSEDKPTDAAAVEKDVIKEANVASEGADNLHEQRKSGASHARSNSVSDVEPKMRSPSLVEERNIDEKCTGNSAVLAPEAAVTSEVTVKEANEELPCCSSSEIQMEDKSAVHKQSGITGEQKPFHEPGAKNENSGTPSGSSNVLDIELKADDLKAGNGSEQIEKLKMDVDSSDLDRSNACTQDESDRKLVNPLVESAFHKDSSAVPAGKAEQCMRSSGCEQAGVKEDVVKEPASRLNSAFPTSEPDMGAKMDFDLNEGFSIDDGSQGEPGKSPIPGNSPPIHVPYPLPIPVSSMSGSFPASITVAAAAKGPFVPPENPLRIKGELGWKGSAATSAFRPAEPRKVFEMPLSFSTTDVPVVDNTTSKRGRPLLDIDLNVPDERILEDLASQNTVKLTCMESGSHDRSGGGLDLDLNRIEESSEQFSVSNSCRLEVPQFPGKPPFSGGFSKAESNTSRNFDLNNGPSLDEAGAETTLLAKNNFPFLSSVPGVRFSNPEQGNLSSWFPRCNPYSAIAIPSILPSRGEQSYPVVPAPGSQRILGPPPASSSFGPEMYRTPVLSSSPAVAFPPGTPFHYPGFPFETNFSLQSNSYTAGSTTFVDSSSAGSLCFPGIHSQLVGPTGVVSTHYPRPYVMGLPGATSNVSLESRKWGSQGLDLNAGPGGTDIERRDERLPCGLRQLPLSVSQALPEEQLKMYQMSGALKRNQPDGGWDGDRTSYRQPQWQ